MGTRSDAEWLLRDKYNGHQSAAFMADRARLATGEPLGYVIGWVPFLDCAIWLKTRPLIPRPETEFWVARVIAQMRKDEIVKPRVLDLCAGSGCIGVAVAKALPAARVDCSEIEVTHHPTIKKNATVNKVAIDTIYGGDLFADLPADRRYHYILSNPPYLDPANNQTEPSVTNWEPARALFAGAGGLEIIKRVIMGAPAFLVPAGQLWLEHEPSQTVAIASLGRAHNFTVTSHKDQYGVKRFSTLVLQ